MNKPTLKFPCNIEDINTHQEWTFYSDNLRNEIRHLKTRVAELLLIIDEIEKSNIILK